MENHGFRQDVPRDPVGQFLTYEGRSIALVDLGRVPSDALRKSWSTDRPFQSGGIIESAWLVPMLGGGSTAAASLLAGNVFLATANSGTLMTIGSGVGSAVMGPTGIVAHAPFVAASGALIPVVAPMMLCATVLSVTICARLDQVQRALGRLYDVVERVRHLLEAEDYARFETAAEQIEEIRSEFEHCGRFASDVPDRLARVEHHVSLLRSKYGVLKRGGVDSEETAESMVSDLNRFFLASLYDLWTDMLQLYLALQNDPDVVEVRHSRLREKIERYRKDFRQLLDDDPAGDFHRKMKRNPDKSRRWRDPFGRGRDTRVRKYRAIRKDFIKVQAHINQWVDETDETATDKDESRQHSIVIYREPDGERAVRAYHTRDVRLERAGT